jgi:hypothetical protein
LLEDVWRRYGFRITACLLILVAGFTAIVTLFVVAINAVVNNFNKPCDQPLRWYIFVMLAVGQSNSRLVSVLSQRLPGVASCVGACPGMAILGWGLYMIHASHSCAKTCPEIYYPMRRYIYGQACFFALLSIYATVGLSMLLLYASSLGDDLMPGCEETVRKFPKVPSGDASLLDTQTWEPLECPICADSYDGGKGVVRTPCEHLFHEDCLARWCKNHVDCPICRGVFADKLLPRGEEAV